MLLRESEKIIKYNKFEFVIEMTLNIIKKNLELEVNHEIIASDKYVPGLGCLQHLRFH